jgi:hypothetical protein
MTWLLAQGAPLEKKGDWTAFFGGCANYLSAEHLAIFLSRFFLLLPRSKPSQNARKTTREVAARSSLQY